jgi:hypoxanthine phosphoribosyltransferase
LIGLNQDLSGRSVVEDIVDMGNTGWAQGIIQKTKCKTFKIASFLQATEAYKKDIKIDYVGIEFLINL